MPPNQSIDRAGPRSDRNPAVSLRRLPAPVIHQRRGFTIVRPCMPGLPCIAIHAASRSSTPGAG